MNSWSPSHHLDPKRWFWGFIVIHLLIWTLVPGVSHLNLPLDAMEGTTWGHQLELGYDKNPFMNAWLTAFVVWISGHTDWAIYFTGTMCTVICFWAVYRLGCKFLSAWHALIAIMLLEGMQYYTLSAMDLNDNVLEIALWPLMVLSFYNAIKTQRWRDWLGVALFSGLATMTKYYVVVMLLPMLIFLLVNPTARNSFKRPVFYLALLLYIAIIIPHFIWLVQHHWVTLDYAFDKTATDPSVNKHIYYAFHFSINYLAACLIPLLMFAVFYTGKKTPALTVAREIEPFEKQFILVMGLGPITVTLLLSIVFGLGLHTGWGAPLPFLWGLILVSYAQPAVTIHRWYRFIATITVLVVITGAIYIYSKVTAGDTSSANYPGRQMAQELTQQWRKRYHTKLAYVAGPRWIAGNIAYYSPDQPTVYMEWNSRVSPWIDEQDLARQGALFIWPDNFISLEQLKQRFPKLAEVSIMHFTWQRAAHAAGKRLLPVTVWVGFMPPSES